MCLYVYHESYRKMNSHAIVLYIIFIGDFIYMDLCLYAYAYACLFSFMRLTKKEEITVSRNEITIYL